MLQRTSRTIAAFLLIALAVMVPARAGGGPDRSRKIRQLALEPIVMGERQHAQGSDLAFKGRTLVAGTYQGTALFRILPEARGALRQVGFHACPGSQGDVSVLGDYVFVSIDSASSNSTQTSVCNNTPTNRSPSSTGKEGIRIVDVSDLRSPRQVGFIETDCGSHTHTLVPGGRRSYIYVESYPISGQGPTCNAATHRKVSIVEFETADPTDYRLLDPFDVSPAIGCHDVTVFTERDLAVAACITESQIWDVSNPAKPKTLATIRNPGIEIHHSSAVTWDGKVAAIGDEHGGAAAGGCVGDADAPVGAMWFYDIRDAREPQMLGHHALPRLPEPDSAEEAARLRCTTHNYNVVPMRHSDHYVAAVAYYQGGLAVIDFSDPSDVEEIAHYVAQPGGVAPDTWSAYWYNGRIYTNDHLSEHGVGVYEVDGLGRSATRYFDGAVNPQTQIARFR